MIRSSIHLSPMPSTIGDPGTLSVINQALFGRQYTPPRVYAHVEGFVRIPCITVANDRRTTTSSSTAA